LTASAKKREGARERERDAEEREADVTAEQRPNATRVFSSGERKTETGAQRHRGGSGCFY